MVDRHAVPARALRLLVVLALAACSATTEPPADPFADEPEARRIVDAMAATYAACTTYRDRGESIHDVMTIPRRPGEPLPLHHRLRAPDAFRFAWVVRHGDDRPIPAVAWSSGRGVAPPGRQRERRGAPLGGARRHGRDPGQRRRQQPDPAAAHARRDERPPPRPGPLRLPAARRGGDRRSPLPHRARRAQHRRRAAALDRRRVVRAPEVRVRAQAARLRREDDGLLRARAGRAGGARRLPLRAAGHRAGAPALPPGVLLERQPGDPIGLPEDDLDEPSP